MKWKKRDTIQYARIGRSKVRIWSGHHQSRSGNGFKWYSGKGGRMKEEAVVLKLVAIVALLLRAAARRIFPN